MEKIIFIIAFLMVATAVRADWYIINTATNRAVAKTKYLPDAEDLESRGEIAVKSDVEINLEEAELFQGKIQARAKSQQEKNAIQEAKEKQEEYEKIRKKADLLAIKALEQEGESFKHFTEDSFK